MERGQTKYKIIVKFLQILGKVATVYPVKLPKGFLSLVLKLNVFNVKMLTMHRWFNISAAERDLGYTPIVGYAEGWADCLTWFKGNWLPKFNMAKMGVFGIAEQSQDKIDIQASGTGTATKDKAA